MGGLGLFGTVEISTSSRITLGILKCVSQNRARKKDGEVESVLLLKSTWSKGNLQLGLRSEIRNIAADSAVCRTGCHFSADIFFILNDLFKTKYSTKKTLG